MRTEVPAIKMKAIVSMNRGSRSIIGILLSLLSSLMLVFSFPTLEYHYFIWVAFVPLWISLLCGGKGLAFCFGFLSGMGYYIGTSPWLWDIMTWQAGLLLPGFLSLYFALPALVVRLLYPSVRRFSLIVGPVWILFEYIRSNLFFLALPTVLISHTQYQNTGLIQMISWTGEYGLSLLIMTANGALADAAVYWFRLPGLKNGLPSTRDQRSPFPAALGMIALVFLIRAIGTLSLPNTSSGTPLNISVVHGNIAQDKKWDRRHQFSIISQYDRLSMEVIKYSPDLIVWPETATPGFVLNNSFLYDWLKSLVQRLNTPLLLGSAEYPKFAGVKKTKETANTALLFSSNGRLQDFYLKTKLVPFFEYLPAKEIIPWPSFIVDQEKAQFNIANKEIKLLYSKGIPIGPLICWEVCFPEFSRKLINKGARILINLSNEAWFQKGGIPTGVLAVSVFRAVENRVNVVRSTNCGISGFIDPYGRISGTISATQEGELIKMTSTKTVYLSTPGTFYSVFGDIVILLSLLYLAGLIYWSRLKR